jgi:hypothetical protein
MGERKEERIIICLFKKKEGKKVVYLFILTPTTQRKMLN